MFTLDELKGKDINRLENVVTLAPNVHTAFGKFDLWLEPLEVCTS
jgi:hypothetical protein